jgi:radical SAM protein with 4Fe4S-binding SPASM domain
MPGRRPLTGREVRDVVKKIGREAKLKYVLLTGGEPTLRPDFAAIVRGIVDDGTTPTIVTNGVRLNGTLLSRLPPGLTYEITLFSHRAEVHNALAGRPVFEDVVRNIAAVEKHGSHCVVAFVATRLNAMDVYRTVELALALGASAVMYNRLNIGAGIRGHERELVPPAELLRNSLLLLQEAVRNYRFPIVCTIPIPPCVVDHTPFPDLHLNWCPRGGQSAYYTVGSTGLLRPCNHSSTVLGDMLQSGFRELVESPQARSFWQEIPAVCRNCEHALKDACRGGCLAAADEYYGNRLKPDPICELAFSG